MKDRRHTLCLRHGLRKGALPSLHFCRLVIKRTRSAALRTAPRRRFERLASLSRTFSVKYG